MFQQNSSEDHVTTYYRVQIHQDKQVLIINRLFMQSRQHDSNFRFQILIQIKKNQGKPQNNAFKKESNRPSGLYFVNIDDELLLYQLRKAKAQLIAANKKHR